MSLITIETDDSKIVIDTVKPIVSTLETTIDFPRRSADARLPGEAITVPVQGIRFTKVDADGMWLLYGDKRTDHVAVLDHTTGLMWSVQSLGDPADEDDGITQEHCSERCRQLRLLGHDDWRLPTRAELVALIDDTRHKPAIDTEYFPRVKPRWHWTSTPAAWSSASAWFVHFNGGLVGYGPRYDGGFALAVRRAGQ